MMGPSATDMQSKEMQIMSSNIMMHGRVKPCVAEICNLKIKILLDIRNNFKLHFINNSKCKICMRHTVKNRL